MDFEIYLSQEEVDEFCASNQTEIIGYFYEWEGENVIHIHSHPILHSFGKKGRCLFTKLKIEDCHLTNDIGFVICMGTENNIEDVCLFIINDGQHLQVSPKFIPSKSDLYSRSKGLLEIDILSKKHVAIVGLGSFGSQIAIELSKAGVGEFTLIDFDRIELHNLGRHTCTLKDLGRLKTDAIEDSILGKNPYAKVHKYPIDIVSKREIFSQIVDDVDLVICATDNNNSRYVISIELFEKKKVGIFGRAITRAAGGDVFRYRPGGPCYACLIGSHVFSTKDEEISSEESGRRSGVIPQYASREDVNTMVQVGLSADIEPICNLMIKLSLLELSKGKQSGISSLEEDLKYDAYIWANRRDKNFSQWHPFFKSGTKPTILKWYGLQIPKDDHCVICSESPILDTGLEFRYNPQDLSNANITLD